jgi:hypothetical protein
MVLAHTRMWQEEGAAATGLALCRMHVHVVPSIAHAGPAPKDVHTVPLF